MIMVKTIWGILLGLGITLGLGQGEASMDDGIAADRAQRIELDVAVKASVDDVWHAWTTNEGIQTFFSQYSRVELKIGGPFEILFDGKIGSNGCKVLSYLPKEMLSFSWNAPPKFAHARQHHTWVVLRFEEVGKDSTRVKLTHLGWEEMKIAHSDHAAEWDQVYAYFSEAWPYVLANLARRFETGPRWE